MSELSNPAKPVKALLGGIAGTTAMTAFSYGLSRAMKEQFREPELLSFLVYKEPIVRLTGNYKATGNTTGFLLHYLPGFGFAAGYEYLWKPFVKLPTLAKGATYGVVAGLVGTAIWEAVIRLRTKPPRLDKGKYYTHLVFAHVVFGAATALASRAMSKNDK